MSYFLTKPSETKWPLKIRVSEVGEAYGWGLRPINDQGHKTFRAVLLVLGIDSISSIVTGHTLLSCGKGCPWRCPTFEPRETCCP